MTSTGKPSACFTFGWTSKDAAIMRPGRIDLKAEFKKPNLSSLVVHCGVGCFLGHVENSEKLMVLGDFRHNKSLRIRILSKINQ